MLYSGTTYAEADKFLGKRASRVIGYNTRMYRNKDYFTGRRSIEIYYHSTCIVKYLDDGRTSISTGGWATATTIKRINWFTKTRLHSRLGKLRIYLNDARYEFFNGMFIDEKTGVPIE